MKAASAAKLVIRSGENEVLGTYSVHSLDPLHVSHVLRSIRPFLTEDDWIDVSDVVYQAEARLKELDALTLQIPEKYRGIVQGEISSLVKLLEDAPEHARAVAVKVPA